MRVARTDDGAPPRGLQCRAMQIPKFAALILISGVVLSSLVPATLSGQEPGDYSRLVELFQEIRSLDLERLPNLEATTFEQRAEQVEDLRERLAAVDPRDWEVAQKIDYLVTYAALARLRFEHGALRPWRRDPGFYVDRIARIPFRELPLETAARDELAERLRQVPDILANARENLTEGARQLALLALRNLEEADGVGHGHPFRESPPAGVIGWYEDLLKRAQTHHPELGEQVETALSAIRGFRDWLQEAAPKMTRPAGVGPRRYAWYLRNAMLLPFDPEEVLTIGERELDRALSSLALEEWRNRGLPPVTPAPDEEEYERRIAEADALVRSFLQKEKILTLPPETPAFGHNVPFVRRAGGLLNFWEAVQFRDPLPDHVHAVVPGHRFDAWLHELDQRPIRGKFFDSGRVEGWGLYVEEMLLQAGLLKDRPRTRELFYIFQAARAVRNRAEIAMHLNRWSVAAAVKYMVDQVPFMDPDVARVDCEIYLRRPGYGISYLMGKIQIEQLLAERKRQQGDQFELTRFHDRFLASGWIPISLIHWEMTGVDRQVEAFWKAAGVALE